MEYIICAGDSLTFGARDEFYRSYPAELGRIFWEREKRNVHCVNYGVNGETSSGLLNRIYSNSRSCSQARVALLLIGTNDTLLPQDPDIYRDNLRQIINILKDGGRSVVIGLLPPIVGPGIPMYDKEAQKLINKFNQIIIGTSRQHKCFLADFRDLGKYIIDTVHFNHRGYVEMAEIWYRVLKENKLC